MTNNTFSAYMHQVKFYTLMLQSAKSRLATGNMLGDREIKSAALRDINRLRNVLRKAVQSAEYGLYVRAQLRTQTNV